MQFHGTFYSIRIVVPAPGELNPQLITAHHDSSRDL
jgi:hypothetical protein